MTEVKREASVAAVIGDLVGSRTARDRADLHARLSALLQEANEELDPVVPLRITAGDEFQGCFAEVGAALRATLWLRLGLLPEADLRHGVGWGPVTVLADEPRVEDGPGWWSARAAIEWAKSDAARWGLRSRRTAYERAEDVEGPDTAAVNAALICRDQMVGSLSERSLRLLRGLLAGRPQAVLAEEEKVTASAVSQRVRNDGLGAIVAAEEMLGRVR